jgi:recombination protein RecR
LGFVVFYLLTTRAQTPKYMSSNTLINTLIKKISKLPGLGQRSARRIALHLLTRGRDEMVELSEILRQTEQIIRPCQHCHNLTSEMLCDICQDEHRNRREICVVRDVSDLWALERTQIFKGLYHVLGGVLSALDGIGPDQLDIDGLLTRIKQEDGKEVILALGATVDGQSTAHYISDILLKHYPDITITKLAQGVPVGGELDYMDEGTLITAMKARR